MNNNGYPPFRRFRRLRRTEGLRRMVRETVINPDDFIYPMFITAGTNVRREVPSMPSVFQVSVDQLPREMYELQSLGLSSVLLFGIPDHKDEIGSSGYAENGIIQQAVRAIKEIDDQIVVVTDVCNCEYTSHGHCGIMNGEEILNDETLDLLVKSAISHAAAGADVVAPSDMMDGRVGAIRQGLDQNGFINTPILSYAAKYASAFYGPFRDAAESVPSFGDRRSHQMDPANRREAYLEIEADLDEGADGIIIKPAMTYLDVVSGARERYDVPIAAYNVSGEYAMIKAAARNGWIDEQRVILETMTSIKRAGANLIISYHAKEVAAWLQGQQLSVEAFAD
ncbi:MAG: porphobilinogen synthase [Sphaerobacteraceae bacterium]|nr:MAG: porphobilinogen synthase [Sphaerobacteraceae bacterium]